MTNSSQTLVPSSDQLPAARVIQPGETAPSQEDAERNRFYRYRYRYQETAAEDAERNKFYRHLSLPNKRGRPKKSGETAVSRRDIEMLTKHANKIRETKLKAKKVRMERERRKGLAQLFDNLQASVDGQTNSSEKLPRWRSSYLARTLAAVDCIKELELKVLTFTTILLLWQNWGNTNVSGAEPGRGMAKSSWTEQAAEKQTHLGRSYCFPCSSLSTCPLPLLVCQVPSCQVT